MKLHQLTSLRFFAALMIVIHHSSGLFGISGDIPIPLDQGVCFFFVLSGFILTYAYPTLASWTDVLGFWRARVARIWPAYFVSFLLGFWLCDYTWNTSTAIANLLMVQAWIPLSKYYFSYNAVCWSLSVEFFFYLLFPILIYQWSKTWHLKLFIAGVMAATLISLSNIFHLEGYSDPSGKPEVTQHALLYISPLIRIFEFIFGMCVALGYSKTIGFKLPISIATVAECAALALCAASLTWMGWTGSVVYYLHLGPAGSLYMGHSSSTVAFGILIYVMAIGRGLISKLLSYPVFVMLGEISYSVYLTHRIFIEYYRANQYNFRLSEYLAFLLLLAVILLTSYLIWYFIETPFRRLIAGKHESFDVKYLWHYYFTLNRSPLLAIGALSCLLLIVSQVSGKLFISERDANRLTPPSLQSYQGVTFGNLFTLRGLDIVHTPKGFQIKLAWQSQSRNPLPFFVGVHLVNSNRQIQSQGDYKLLNQNVDAGAVWLDTIVAP
jgi:peptidoglycan/LPS O-acetylase OafA/YrhL